MRSLLEPGLPAKNGNAVYLSDRVVCIAGKPRSNIRMRSLLEPGLPAKNGNAVYLSDRVA
jgi:hypothetical protein